MDHDDLYGRGRLLKEEQVDLHGYRDAHPELGQPLRPPTDVGHQFREGCSLVAAFEA